jgi:hypothetical protein
MYQTKSWGIGRAYGLAKEMCFLSWALCVWSVYVLHSEIGSVIEDNGPICDYYPFTLWLGCLTNPSQYGSPTKQSQVLPWCEMNSIYFVVIL